MPIRHKSFFPQPPDRAAQEIAILKTAARKHHLGLEGLAGRLDDHFHKRVVELDGDPNITIEHFGIKGWSGNLHEHILKPPEELAKINAELKAAAEIRSNADAAQKQFQDAVAQMSAQVEGKAA